MGMINPVTAAESHTQLPVWHGKTFHSDYLNEMVHGPKLKPNVFLMNQEDRGLFLNMLHYNSRGTMSPSLFSST